MAIVIPLKGAAVDMSNLLKTLALRFNQAEPAVQGDEDVK
jgi:hypothetical protein